MTVWSTERLLGLICPKISSYVIWGGLFNSGNWKLGKYAQFPFDSIFWRLELYLHVIAQIFSHVGTYSCTWYLKPIYTFLEPLNLQVGRDHKGSLNSPRI